MSQRQRAYDVACQMAAGAGQPLPALDDFAHLSDAPDNQEPAAAGAQQRPPQAPPAQARSDGDDLPELDALDDQTRGIVTRAVGQVLARQELRHAATDRLHNPADVLAYIDPATVLGTDGRPDQQRVADAMQSLSEARPHLFRPEALDAHIRRASADSGQGAGAGPTGTTQQRVDAVKTQMQEGTRW